MFPPCGHVVRTNLPLIKMTSFPSVRPLLKSASGSEAEDCSVLAFFASSKVYASIYVQVHSTFCLSVSKSLNDKSAFLLLLHSLHCGLDAYKIVLSASATQSLSLVQPLLE